MEFHKPKNVELDCAHFKGDVPCWPNKEKGLRCRCEHFVERGKRILIIKLGAAGDVIRTTPLIRKLREEYKNCEITWLTNHPEVLEGVAENVLAFNESGAAVLRADSFDILYNFDKDRHACAMANIIEAKEKRGFCLYKGKCVPIDANAEHKFLTGVFDDISMENKLSYHQEIFGMAGFRFSGEKYILNAEPHDWNLPEGARIIGLNTGAGERWETRLWPEEKWIGLAKLLLKNNFYPVLLGGEKEHESNLRISRSSGANYPGYHPLKKFISLINECEAIVTCVTMTLHLGIALGKKLVLLNNIFNKNEFELYNLGKIIEPPQKCECYYRKSCIKSRRCMEYLQAEDVFNSLLEVLG